MEQMRLWMWMAGTEMQKKVMMEQCKIELYVIIFRGTKGNNRILSPL